MIVKQNASKIYLRSDEINEILGIPPRWLIRWGITILFVVIAIVIVGSAFFSYPDIVTAQAVITTENPSSLITAKAGGKPAKLFFPDGADVQQGDTLAVIDNPAYYADIFLISRVVASINRQGTQPDSLMASLHKPDTLVLGEVQQPYNSFTRALSNYSLFIRQKLYPLKVKALEGELDQYRIYYDRLWAQRNLTLKDLAIAEKQFARDSLLFRSNVIPTAEFEKSQTALLARKQTLESARISLSNAAITIERLKQTIADTKFEQESRHKQVYEEFINAHRQLRSSLSAWAKTYMLIAPSAGKLSLVTVWSELQEVKPGDVVFAINPAVQGAPIARLVLPFEGAGKVKLGQRVNIKLDSYPYMEFGMVEAEIVSVAGGAIDKGYPAVAKLTVGAVTTYREPIPLERELIGVAEVTTEEQTLLQRLFNPLKHLLKSRVLTSGKQ